ncbi:EAL domain-containing protein [Labrenzia sp. VG12]|uniref:EAL domain-containing protein n=1 Tax=Labrenzia sp. VG12 TaxID=2021862 RepID=UPI001AD91CC3|nr:EAL domain-containing protein [Labrenzia sp. VG12]
MTFWRAVFEKRVFNAALISICVIAVVAMLRLTGLGTTLDRFLWETRFLASERSVSGDIVVVDIDAKSLDELGVWPLPRRLFAEMTDKLVADGARDIVFDVDFSANSNPEDDALLAAAFERAGNVSLAVFRQSASVDLNAGEVVNQPIQQLLDTAWPVVVMVPMERDSRIWRNLYGFEIDGTAELSAAAYLGDHTGSTEGAFWLDYSIGIDKLDRVSLIDVLQGAFPSGQFLDKKVVVGASAQELRDLFPVPVYGMLPGSIIQALGGETLLQGRALEQRGEALVVGVAVLIVFLMFLTRADGWFIKLSILALTALAIELIAFGLQKSAPLMVPTASAHFVLLVAAAGIVFRELGFYKLLSHLATIRRRNSERMLGLVFDDSFDAIVVLQDDGKISAASQMARDLFQTDALLGKQARNVLPPELVEEALSVLATQTTKRPVPKVLTLLHNDGARRYIEYVVTRSERSVASPGNSKKVATKAVACLTCRDVTEEREAVERLAFLARFDPSTGLSNRNGFEEKLDTALQTARGSGHEVCVIQVAVTNLDQIVASLGFSYGDQVRKAISSRLKNHLAQKAEWATLSPEVFAGVFVCQQGQDLAMIETLKDVVGEDYKVEGARISVQLKFGYIVSDGDMSPEGLLRKSGNALAKVRRDHQGQTLGFQPEMDAALQRRRTLETELFKAIVRDELHMVYQPLVNLDDQSIFGVEALLRWDHRELGPISPAEFVPIAEENGYIVELGAWALNRGMKEALSWSSPLRLSVNISAIQLSRGNLVASVKEALDRTGFPADRLDLEITESLFIDDSLDLDYHMNALKALGCSFSLDDFGTGYSSLSYIPKYPFSKIKLDRTFVRQSISSEQDIAVIESVLHLAKGYRMSVVVEGIETPDQASKLQELGCEYGQGFLFGRPMSAINLATLLINAA